MAGWQRRGSIGRRRSSICWRCGWIGWRAAERPALGGGGGGESEGGGQRGSVRGSRDGVYRGGGRERRLSRGSGEEVGRGLGSVGTAVP
ncbi:hypothetical protein GQ55_3G169900 [Panicum hallii var. hallii]|uniref:Uncharacterized protein n=1 Tax=Panicum hallii var. hallii TaxID=1504633 RepID=A0A2T7EAA5_9POAL|nr:hypothetical protein GQ55_3G169900 [Panicum hallii var. hallii]